MDNYLSCQKKLSCQWQFPGNTIRLNRGKAMGARHSAINMNNKILASHKKHLCNEHELSLTGSLVTSTSHPFNISNDELVPKHALPMRWWVVQNSVEAKFNKNLSIFRTSHISILCPNIPINSTRVAFSYNLTMEAAHP